MKKYIPLIIAFAGIQFGSQAKAQLPTIDAAHILTSEVNWLTNFAEWAKNEANQVTQITNQVTQIQQMYTNLLRLGDPATLLGMLGLNGLTNNIATILDSYQQLQQSAEGIQALARYGIPNVTFNGLPTNLDPDYFRNAALVGNISEQFTARSAANDATRQRLNAQMKQTLEQVDSATDQATVDRLSAKLQVLAAQKNSLDNADQAAAAASTIATNEQIVSKEAAARAAALQIDAQFQNDMRTASQGSFSAYRGFEPIKQN
jgi:hypothetical protein